MKVFIAVLCLVGTTSIQEETPHVYEFTKIERYWTACPKNSVFYTRNQSEPSQEIILKQMITTQKQLLVSVEVTHTDSGETVYSKESLEICNFDHWWDRTWRLFVLKFFKITMLDKPAWNGCPIFPAKYQIHRFIDPLTVFLKEKIPVGHYEISYIAKSYDGELVFSPLKYKFFCTDVTYKLRN